jgi:hypothetical protein
MRASFVAVALLGYAVVLLSGSQPARADSFSMAAGMQSAAGPWCYDFGVLTGVQGVVKSASSGCFSETWVMPLYWRNFPGASVNRTVSVRGQVPSSSALMSCTLYAFNSNGTLVAQNTGSFPVTSAGTYSSINLTVNNITSTGTSFITCNSVGSATYLMKVDYAP